MPCDSEYLEPTQRERQLRRAARLLIYLLTELGDVVPRWVKAEAADQYASSEETIPRLCATLKALTPEQRERVVYNPHNKTARALADWWEEHQAADRRRIAAEARAAEKETARLSALSKLSTEEREALGVK